MIKVQKFEVAKMVMTDSINAAYTVSNGDTHKLTFSTRDIGNGPIDDKGLVLVTQKGHIKEFKSLDAVRRFLKDVGITSFSVIG